MGRARSLPPAAMRSRVLTCTPLWQGGLCRDLSLGYKVGMSASRGGKLQASHKRVVEVSIVKEGARDDCHIRGWSSDHHILL